MSKDRINEPRANILIGSMRSMGYTFESAMGDNGGEVQYAYDTDGTLVDGFGENDERTLVMKY